MTITATLRRALGLPTEAEPADTEEPVAKIEALDPANRAVAVLITDDSGRILLGQIPGTNGIWGPTAFAPMWERDYWSFETAIRAIGDLGIDLARLQSGGSQIMDLGKGPSPTDWWIARRCVTAKAIPATLTASVYKWVAPGQLLTELSSFFAGLPAPDHGHYAYLANECRA